VRAARDAWISWSGGLLDDLMARVDEGSLQAISEGEFLPELVKQGAVSRVLLAELSDHLGYERHDRAGHGSSNSRNGFSGKRLGTEWAFNALISACF
jgi:putative transposase